MMSFVVEIFIALAIVIGGTFVLVGSLGLLKLPDLMSRLHGPSKATTLGVGGCLLASMLHFSKFNGDLSMHELLVTLFLFITAPVTAHFIALAHLHTHPHIKTECPLPKATVDGQPTKPFPRE